MADLPETDDGVSQWCKDIFVAKDALLDKYFSVGTFGDEEKHIGRPLKSLLVVVFWFSVLLYGAFRFFKWSALLSSWKGVAIFTVALLLVGVVMHIFIVFSQAERSSTAKAARNRAKKD